MKTKYLIIGSSAAGWSAALTLSRLANSDDNITCITDQNFDPYNKCLLVDNLENKSNIQDLFLIKDKNILDKIKLIKNTKIINFNYENRFVESETNKKFYFDKLLIATGTSALSYQDLNIKTDINLNSIKFFHTLEDLEILKKSIKPNQKVIIIGAGVTGLECADALNNLGVKVTVVEKQKNLFENLITKEASYNLENIIRNSGINLITNESLIKLEKLKVTLTNNLELETDHIILCAGIKPNTDFLKNSKINLNNRFIIVNQNLETNLQDIYSAGDCCLIKSENSGNFINSRLWPEAIIQGMLAAKSILGQNAIYPIMLKYPTTKLAGETISFSGILKNNN